MGKLSTQDQLKLRKYLGTVKDEMSRSKLAAIRLGERKRDMALFNYSRRYGYDNMLGLVYPYQFWLGRAMMNWSTRIMDRPAFLSWMARFSQFAEEMQDETKNYPARLRGKMRLPMRWLPEWAGGALFVDPLSKLLPLQDFVRPMDQMAMSQDRAARVAEQLLRQWVSRGEISQAEMDAALQTRAGAVWERATAQANQEEGSGDVLDYMQLFTSPAMYLTVPYQLASGQGNKVQPTPLSRIIQGLTAATGIDWLENLDLEAKARQKAGMSAFGEYGDYYVDRQLANMAADGTISAKDAQMAMIERSGAAYEEAYKRVQMELGLREPAMGAIYAMRQALSGKANVGDVALAAMAGLLSSGMIPTGELKLRGLAEVYNQAWKDYKAGDEQALSEFFADNPEYEARLALYDKPDERLRQMLVSEVWDRYSQLPDLHKKQAREQLGEAFTAQFLSNETRDYDSLSIETLAGWAQAMGGDVPGNVTPAETGLALEGNQVTAAYQIYGATRDRLFPNMDEIYQKQNEYYTLDKMGRKYFLKQNPDLKAYWDWRRGYIEQHPEIEPFMKSSEKAAGDQANLFGGMDVANWPVEVQTALAMYVGFGDALTPGVTDYLRMEWEKAGRPGGSFAQWLMAISGK